MLGSIWIAGQAERMLQQKDPGVIVIDEICGLVFTLIGLPFTWVNVALGFILFRALDIAKPFPIRTLECRFKGGTGIIMDDVAAGIIANITLRIVTYIFEL
jgi:phosphatidylglycerophosphatase A